MIRAYTGGPAEQSTFDRLKKSITVALALISPDSTSPFRIEADSSDFATGAVLSQVCPTDGKWHPVAFFSKSLSPVERNYEIHNKEMLAIIRTLQEWRHFVEGAEHQFEIWTDHKNLEYFMSAKQLNWRQARWSLYLARFTCICHYYVSILGSYPSHFINAYGTNPTTQKNRVLLWCRGWLGLVIGFFG